jgi:hypothetical protein
MLHASNHAPEKLQMPTTSKDIFPKRCVSFDDDKGILTVDTPGGHQMIPMMMVENFH